MKINQPQWMAVYTKPRSEKKVAERLEAGGVEIYCPLQTTIRQWSDRKKKVKIPVFPSYVFVRVEERDRLHVLQDPGVLNFVHWLGKPAVIKDYEIEDIRVFLGEHEAEELEIVDIREGDKVRIRSGAFASQSAVVARIHKSSSKHASRVELLIESLGMNLRVSTKAINIDQI